MSRALLSALAAGLIARKARRLAILHGPFVGIGVELLKLATSLSFGGRISFRALAVSVLPAGMGRLGALIGAMRRRHVPLV